MRLTDYKPSIRLSYMQLARLMISIRVTCTNLNTFQNLFAETEFSFVHFLNQI